MAAVHSMLRFKSLTFLHMEMNFIDFETKADLREWNHGDSTRLNKWEQWYSLMDDEWTRMYYEVWFRYVNVLQRFIGKDLWYPIGTQFF
jgi:hypothetical protein